MNFELRAKSYMDSLLIFLLVFTPLALGTVHNWSITIFAILAVIIFNLYIFSYPVTLKDLIKPTIVKWGIFFVAIILFQLISLPGNILKTISPATYELYQNYLLSYSDSTLRTLSIYPWATIWELVKVISYALIFLTVLGRVSFSRSYELMNSRAYELNLSNYLRLGCLTAILTILIHSFVDFNLHIPANAFYFTVLVALSVGMEKHFNAGFVKKLCDAIIITGFGIAIFAIVYKFSGSQGNVYWVIEKKSAGIFGPFINYDHYAGYMSMCASLAIASFLGFIRTSSFFNLKRIRDKVFWFSSPEASKTLLYLFFSVIMTASIFLSTSRGGILSFCAAITMLFLLVLIRIKTNRRKRILLAVLLVVLIASIIIVWIGPEAWLLKFERLNKLVRLIIHEGPLSQDIRLVMWRDTLPIIKDFPALGTGFGTFSHAFPKYRSFVHNLEFLRYAHNDYLQLVSELGIFGSIFIVFFIALFLKAYIRTIKNLS